jgi:hypothetical protein
MPFKANADHRHRIPKQQHRVTNWADYEAGLRARGSLTIWFSDVPRPAVPLPQEPPAILVLRAWRHDH